MGETAGVGGRAGDVAAVVQMPWRPDVCMNKKSFCVHKETLMWVTVAEVNGTIGFVMEAIGGLKKTMTDNWKDEDEKEKKCLEWFALTLCLRRSRGAWASDCGKIRRGGVGRVMDLEGMALRLAYSSLDVFEMKTPPPLMELGH